MVAWVIYGCVRLVAATVRFEWVDALPLTPSQQAGPTIYCIWHNRLSLCLILYEKYFERKPGPRGLAAIVSASRDGGLLTRVLQLFRVQPVRGSSSRRGPQALRELVTWAERGFDIAVTPDGPRGPRYRVQPGVISLSQLTGLPIVPVGYHLSSKVSANSWDRFQIPLPFARCQVRFGPALCVPRGASRSEREALREQLENYLLAIAGDD
jgi:lysophospholipid acyltransferase (LPLAT)-like uncharacterized protein